MANDPELAATLVSLEAVHRQVIELLVVVAGFLSRLDDETARALTTRIDRAFDAMEVENIAAASSLARYERARDDR